MNVLNRIRRNVEVKCVEGEVDKEAGPFLA
jgi:hypothetical protein